MIWYVDTGPIGLLDKLMKACGNREYLEEVKIYRMDKSEYEEAIKDERIHTDCKLYAVAAAKVKRFEFGIKEELMDELIANTPPYKLWDKFAFNLRNNKNLRIKLRMSLNCLTEELNVKRYSDILNVLKKVNRI